MILDQNLGQSNRGQVKIDWIVTLSRSRLGFRAQPLQGKGIWTAISFGYSVALLG